MSVLVAMPIIGRWRAGHVFNVVFLIVTMLGVIGLTAYALKNDTEDPDFQAAVKQAHVDAVRINELARRPDGIPLEGAVALLRSDPKSQGPRIFSRNCAQCHRYDGHDGTFRRLVIKEAITKEVDEKQPDGTVVKKTVRVGFIGRLNSLLEMMTLLRTILGQRQNLWMCLRLQEGIRKLWINTPI